MKKSVILKLALLSAAIGLLIVFVVILSGTAYPNMLFRIGAPLGLVLIFVSVLLQFIHWLWEIHDGIKGKQYLWAIIIAVLGCIVIVRVLMRIR